MSPRQQIEEPWGLEQHIGVWGWVAVFVALYLTNSTWIIEAPYEFVRVDSEILTVLFQLLIGPVYVATLIVCDEYLFARRSRWYRRTFRNKHWPRSVLNVTFYGVGVFLVIFSVYYGLFGIIRLLNA